MSQYLLSVMHDDDYYVTDFTTPEMQRIGPQVGAFNEELQRMGAWVFAAGLHSASSATTVRATDSGVTTTDGPYAESKEQMGGFWVIEAADLDAALALGKKATVACERPIEVRPVEGG